MNNTPLIISIIIITIIYFLNTQYNLSIESFIGEEPFINENLEKWLEPRMCYGWFFKIKIPIINITIKICVPGLVIPIPQFGGRGSRSDGYYDCDGTGVCEI
jgi:hypothetical protein